MNSRPVRPVANASGANTEASVSVIATMAKPISRAPLIAACLRGMPASTWRKMFSSMTIASSTTSPIASTRASSVSVLTVKPNAYISPNAPISETGIVTSGYQRRAQAAQEEIDDQHDQQDRLGDRLEHRV